MSERCEFFNTFGNMYQARYVPEDCCCEGEILHIGSPDSPEQSPGNWIFPDCLCHENTSTDLRFDRSNRSTQDFGQKQGSPGSRLCNSIFEGLETTDALPGQCSGWATSVQPSCWCRGNGNDSTHSRPVGRLLIRLPLWCALGHYSMWTGLDLVL